MKTVVFGTRDKTFSLNEKGFSLIDILEDEPLRRAFRDKVEPQKLGMEFAQDFDISKIQFQK